MRKALAIFTVLGQHTAFCKDAYMKNTTLRRQLRRGGIDYLTAVWLNGGFLYENKLLELSIFAMADRLVTLNPPLRQAANRQVVQKPFDTV